MVSGVWCGSKIMPEKCPVLPGFARFVPGLCPVDWTQRALRVRKATQRFYFMDSAILRAQSHFKKSKVKSHNPDFGWHQYFRVCLIRVWLTRKYLILNSVDNIICSLRELLHPLQSYKLKVKRPSFPDFGEKFFFWVSFSKFLLIINHLNFPIISRIYLVLSFYI